MKKFTRKNRVYLALVLLLLYSIVLVKIASPTSFIGKASDPALARFIENFKLLRENWLFFTTDEEVLQAATNAMTNSNIENDRYTEYIPFQNSDQFLNQMNSSFVGIGIEFFATPDYPIVTNVIPNAPASRADMQAGDIIIAVDGTDIRGLTSAQLRDMVIGEPDTEVVLTILRGSIEINKTLVRAAIDTSIDFQLIDDIGYISINQFSTTTDRELTNALNFMNEHNIEKLILDLRGNPGGRLDTLERTLDLFLPANSIVLKARDNRGNIIEYKTTQNSILYDHPMVILVDGNSASAAEAFTAAMSQQLNVPVFGQQTFGKGIMQNFFTYPDQSILKYTNAEWLGPNGDTINREGITPSNPVTPSPLQQALRFGMQVTTDINYDTVSQNLIPFQRVLTLLGYDTGREDGYFSQQTLTALNQFKADNGISGETDLSTRVQAAIISHVIIAANNRSNDATLNAAITYLNQ